MAKRKFSLMFLCVAFSHSAKAADWKILDITKNGGVVFVDVGSVRELPPISIKRPFSIRVLWVKMDFSRDKSTPYRQVVQMHRFNCTDETGMISSSVAYAANGNVANSFSDEDYDFNYKPMTPDTIGYGMMEYACGRRSLPSQ